MVVGSPILALCTRRFLLPPGVSGALVGVTCESRFLLLLLLLRLMAPHSPCRAARLIALPS